MTTTSPSDWISVVDLAREHGKRKQSIFKVVKRLRIEPQKARSNTSRGQVISYITSEEAQRVVAEMAFRAAQEEVSTSEVSTSTETQFHDQGVFYLLLLEPEHDPGRFNVGFAISLPERVRALRCSAPMLKIVKTWPCKLLWEKTAIECVADGCERLHTEVFRTHSVGSIIEKCDRFFELMPKLSAVLK